MGNFLKMAGCLNGTNDSSVNPEWFLKRYGSYTDDLIIDLDEDEIVIGRGNNRALKHSPGVSRRHALFKRMNSGHWLVKDMHSTNGIYINKRKITVDHLEPVKEFDIIGFGVAVAVSNDQFSFIVCRRTKHNQSIGQELKSNCKEATISAQECLLELEQNYRSKLDKINKNIKLENAWEEDNNNEEKIGNYNKELSVFSKKDIYTLENTVQANNILNKNSNKKADTKDMYEACKLNCKVLVKRCDEEIKNFKFLTSAGDEDKSCSADTNDCSGKAVQENAFNTTKIVLENSDEIEFLEMKHKPRKRQIIVSDSDSGNDEDVTSQRNCILWKKKNGVISEESSSSVELLPKNAFPIKCDDAHEGVKNDNKTKGINADDLNREVKWQDKHFSLQCDVQTENKTSVLGTKYKPRKGQIIISDSDSDNDKDATSQRNHNLYKKKNSPISEESSLSPDELLLKNAVPIKHDEAYKDVKNNTEVKETNIGDLNREVKQQNKHCSLHCDVQTENKTSITTSSSKERCDNDIVIPKQNHELQKRKGFVISEETSSSSDEVLLKSALSDKLHQKDLKNDTSATQETNKNDFKVKHHSPQCDVQTETTSILTSSSEEDSDADVIVPQRNNFQKKKYIIASEESSSSSDDHHIGMENGISPTKEIDSNDLKLKQHNNHCTLQCDRGTEKTSISVSSSLKEGCDDDATTPQRCYDLQKRKDITSEENSQSSNALLLESMFSQQTDDLCQRDMEKGIIAATETNKNELIVKQYNQPCSPDQCGVQTENKTSIANSNSKEEKVKSELKYRCSENDIAYDSIISVNDSSVNSKLKCKNENNKNSVSDTPNLDDFVVLEETMGKCDNGNGQLVSKIESERSKTEDIAALEEEENFNYSQNDNIIIISDDDLPPGKQEPNESIVADKGDSINLNIKKEPDKEVHNNEKIDTQGNCFYDCDKTNAPSDEDEMHIYETADDYVDFDDDDHDIDDKVLLNRIAWPPVPDDEEEKTTENDFFPSLSQSFFSDDSSSESSDGVHTKLVSSELQPVEKKIEETPLPKSKSENKPAVKTIEALPMQYRPKSTRGHEEWFTERTGNRVNTNSAGNRVSHTDMQTYSEISKQKFYGNTFDKKVPPTVSSRKRKLPSLKDRLKEHMGHRVRCPGGGSAIVKQETSSLKKIPNAKHSRQWSQNIKGTTKKLPTTANRSVNKPKSVNSAQLIQRFPSRTEQLAKSMLINDSSCSNNKRKKRLDNKGAKGGPPGKQKSFPTSHKRDLNPKIKHQKRQNPFGNFKIPKKKKSSEQENVYLGELDLGSSSNKKKLDENGRVLQSNNTKPQVSASEATNTVQTSVQLKTSIGSSVQKPRIKKVRFAEQIVSTKTKPPLSAPSSAATCKQSCLRKTSSTLDVNTEQIQSPNMLCFVSQENIIAKIVLWNTNWLKEQHAANKPPPVVDFKSLKKVSWEYASALDHWNTYFNLLQLEIWQSLYRAWRESGNRHTDEFCIVNIQKFKDMMILNCQTVVPCTRNNILTFLDGHLAIVELVLITEKQATAVVKSFGYLCDCKMEKYRKEIAHQLLHSRADSPTNSFYLVKFILKIKYRDDDLKISRLMKMTPILYLRPSLRQCEALQNAYDCSLGQHILHPQREICSYGNVSNSALRSPLTYNEKQKYAILGISSAILESTEPRLLLLHGPPGTGKTTVIIGIIHQLLFRHVKSADHQVKLLIASPSNAAVDEIGRRLLKLKSSLVASNGKKVKFVRVGQVDMVHKDLKMYFIDELVKLNLQSIGNDPATNLSHLEAKINMLQHELSSRREHNPYDPVIAQKQKELVRVREEFRLCRSMSDGQGFSIAKQKHKLKINILKNADVILSTLSSCRQGIVEAAFGENSSVTLTCCIIDEATQCTEPEILLPLYYGMNKVVLVGDPQQLPATVYSRVAIRYGFHISLFERLRNYFDSSPGENPVFMLTDQYRMHPEICSYPSSFFYSGLLKSCGANNYFLNFPLKRYLILDITDGQECTDDPSKIYNCAEANFVKFLCSETLRLIPSNCTLGVITPYQGQRRIISEYFHSAMAPEQHRLEVNTVDSFQGRERDVIILSCVRAGGSGSIGFLEDHQRLNVAITRARYSLIICGHVTSLRSHQLWGSLIRNAESRNVLFPVRSSALEVVYDLLKARY